MSERPTSFPEWSIWLCVECRKKEDARIDPLNRCGPGRNAIYGPCDRCAHMTSLEQFQMKERR